MQTSREDFHKFIDQVPPKQLTADVLARVRALVSALGRSGAALGKKSEQTRKSADELATLLTWMRELDLTTPEVREQVEKVQRLVAESAVLEADREYLLALQNAPEDDEEETDEELADVADAREDIRAGQTRAWADVRRDLEAKADAT